MLTEEICNPGLSPLARGTRRSAAPAIRRPRFIPAGAGNTAAVRRALVDSPVYPRWRGELWRITLLAYVDHGLSPLARGTPPAPRCDEQPPRFIPAGAGNTGPFPHREDIITVYPRWRGEHRILNRGGIHFGGLSPLARGTRTTSPCRYSCHRFIPAGAGNTKRMYPQKKLLSVYPRWRGEHARPALCRNYSSGLSPLARGTPCCPCADFRPGRFIPAGAGNTYLARAHGSRSAVYPRWRGEHTKDILLFYNSFLSTQQFTNFITTISHY